ncbi:MAG: SDR family NAD(P)-dependent oxidoreductase [Dehalococcoidia bacterium]|nr:SDR family NAD(P)-dependent oxidoreductase [Dehalococcoidia bacterium]
MTRILVTGGAGFIGGHLVDRLVRDRHDVIVLDNMRRGRASALGQHLRAGDVELVEGDIRDAELLTGVMRGVETVYHLAAQSNVMGAIDDAEYSFTSNALGTFNVLRAAADAGAARLVFTSSREVYGESGYVPVDEDHPLAAKNPYGASKVAGEAYARTFAHCYGLDVAVLRLANVYGHGDRDRVIPLWLDAAAAGRDLNVYGGGQVLDFVWIATVIDALTLAGEEGLPGPTNIGSGVGTSILELARRIIEVGSSRSQIARVPARGAEVTRFVADTTRMRALGIEPESDPLAHLPALTEAYAAGVAV